MRPAPVAVPCTKTVVPEEEIERVSLATEGDTDVHLVECSAEAEPMSSGTTVVAAMQEVEIMDVEPRGRLWEDWWGWMLRCPACRPTPGGGAECQ